MLIYLALLNFSLCGLAEAAGKHPPTVPDHWVGKKVVALAPVRDVQVLLPDSSLHNFGEDFQASLTTQLTQSGKYTVIDAPALVPLDVELRPSELNANKYVWVGSEMPSVTVRITVEALTFQTGSQGDRMFYGFDERLRTPFNDGFSTPDNEFPLRPYSNQPSWFGNSFDRKGLEPFDSLSGLDLGEGFNFDFLFAFLNLKYAKYRSKLHLRLEMDSPLSPLNASRPGTRNYESIEVRGEGFFFDLAGGYQNYTAGITVARRDAMHKAVKAAIQGAFGAIDRALATAPWLAKVDATLNKNLVLMGTGVLSNIQAGTLYVAVEFPNLVIQVLESGANGSVGQVIQGDPALLKVGMILREIREIPRQARDVSPGAPGEVLGDASGDPSGYPFGRAPGEVLQGGAQNDNVLLAIPSREMHSEGYKPPSLVDSVQMPASNFSASNLTGIVQLVTHTQAFMKSLAGLVFLPYRIWRYFAYDQAYHSHADGGGPSTGDRAQEIWRHQIGLDKVGSDRSGSDKTGSDRRESDRSGSGDGAGQDRVNPTDSSILGPTIAIIDSGIDYNHRTIHDSLWLNPGATSDVDGRRDRYGWDFISNDSKPYDDSYHGTQVASLVASVAPAAKILPLKIFNPWGITTSAAIYGAFQYAVDHGAKIILCAWATHLPSEAIKEGVEYARKNGVVVVAAAGDQGLNLSMFPMYPAVLSEKYDNVLTVTSVDFRDRLVQTQGKKPNFDLSGTKIQLAAPGETMWVAEPRGGKAVETSTGLAAAIVAGVLARNIAASPSYSGNSGNSNDPANAGNTGHSRNSGRFSGSGNSGDPTNFGNPGKAGDPANFGNPGNTGGNPGNPGNSNDTGNFGSSGDAFLYKEWIDQVLREADTVEKLRGQVRGGGRVRVLR